MDLSFIILFLTILFILLGLILYSVLKALAVQFDQNHRRILSISVWSTCLYLTLFIAARYFSASMMRLLTYYLGFLSFGLYLSLGYWFLYLICCLIKRKRWVANRAAGIVFLGIYLGVVSTAIYNFQKPISIENFTLYSEKLTKEYRFVHLSDIQFGTISKSEMDKRLKQVYDLNPDFILFTGDLIDLEHYQFEDFDILAKSPVPVYFERGNHDFYHDPTRLLSYLEKIAPIMLLTNKKASIGELEILGIDYNSRKGYLGRILENFDLDPAKFSILLYHEPRGVEEAARKNFDLMLFGHTHGGQIWPYTHLIDYLYRYGDGGFQVDDSFVYTSDGVALWGPRMRLGSQNEIVVFTLKPKPK